MPLTHTTCVAQLTHRCPFIPMIVCKFIEFIQYFFSYRITLFHLNTPSFHKKCMLRSIIEKCIKKNNTWPHLKPHPADEALPPFSTKNAQPDSGTTVPLSKLSQAVQRNV